MAQDNAKPFDAEDLVGIRVYLTRFWPDIDAALRRGDTAKLQEFDAHIRMVTYGLFKLPAFQGVVYRGASLPPAVAEKYQPGITVRERAFISTLADPARVFPGNVQFVIASITGRQVNLVAEVPEEREVVFFTATRFKVLAVDHDMAGGVRTVYLLEIPDPRLIQGPTG
jgi:hypothetical protein